jgi:hypothetical protein
MADVSTLDEKTLSIESGRKWDLGPPETPVERFGCSRPGAIPQSFSGAPAASIEVGAA